MQPGRGTTRVEMMIPLFCASFKVLSPHMAALLSNKTITDQYKASNYTCC